MGGSLQQLLLLVSQHLSRLRILHRDGLPENTDEARELMKEVWAICGGLPLLLEALRTGETPREGRFEDDLRNQRERLRQEREGAEGVAAAVEGAVQAYERAVESVLVAGLDALNPFLARADSLVSESASSSAFKALPYLLLECQLASLRVLMVLDSWDL